MYNKMLRFRPYVIVLILATCCSSHVAQGFEDTVLLQGFSADPPTDPTAQRVIIAYSTDGCKVPLTVGPEGYSYDGSRDKNEREPMSTHRVSLQSDDARNVAMSELQNRVRRKMLEKIGIKGAEFSGNEEVKLKSRYLSSIQFEVTEIPQGLSENDMIELGSDLPCVQYVEKDGFKVADAHEKPIDLSYTTQERNLAYKPNDIYYDKQWALHSHSPFGVGAESSWKEWKGSESMIVAVIDSGCDLNHPDLQGQLWVNMGEEDCENGIDDDNNGYVDDCFGYDWVDNDNNPSPRGSGHGTGAAGIISARGDNGIGITGLCWNCKLMCLRFISGVEGKISNQVAAIDYAVKNGARISNNSYGGYGFSSLEYEAIRRAETAGHLFVASAGNNNLDTDLDQNPHTPSVYALSNILCAGASTPDGKKASFSNFGMRTVDVFAPGTNIQTIEDGGRYALVSGTSFAAPMATGAAALVWSKYPQLSNILVRKSIMESCNKSDYLEYESFCGGVIDIYRALNVAKHYATTLKDFDVPVDDESEFDDSLPSIHQNTHQNTHQHSNYPTPHLGRLVGTHTSHTSAHTPTGHSSSHYTKPLRLNPIDNLLGGWGKLLRSSAHTEDASPTVSQHRLELLDGHLLDENKLLERALPTQLLEGPIPLGESRKLLNTSPKELVHSMSSKLLDENRGGVNVDGALKSLEDVVNRLPRQDIHRHPHQQLKLRSQHPLGNANQPAVMSAIDGVVHSIHGQPQYLDSHNTAIISQMQQRAPLQIGESNGLKNMLLDSSMTMGAGLLDGRQGEHHTEADMPSWPPANEPTIKRIDDPAQI